MAYKFPVETLPCCAFIDSGIGGLPYLQEFNKLTPETPCIYVADTANFPYGEKDIDDIREAIEGVIQRLLWEFPPSVIVLACNTISVSALETVRARFPIVPIVGTVPAIKKAASLSKNKVIGLLASGDTVKSAYTADLIAEFASDCKVIKRTGSKLIRAIERRLILENEVSQIEAVRPFVQVFINKGADAVVLGCTHFLILRDAFSRALGHDIQIVDSLEGVAQQALKLLKEAKEENGIPEMSAEEKKEREINGPVNYLFTTASITGQQLETYRRCMRLYNLRSGGLI